jgi:hypothetical protein
MATFGHHVDHRARRAATPGGGPEARPLTLTRDRMKVTLPVLLSSFGREAKAAQVLYPQCGLAENNIA